MIEVSASSQPARFSRAAHARAVEATAARATTTQARRTPSATSRSSSHSQLRARRGGEGLQTVQSPARKSEANELHLWCLPSSPVPGPMLSSPPRRLVSILYSYMLMSILYPSACARQTCSKALGPVLEASRLRRVNSLTVSCANQLIRPLPCSGAMPPPARSACSSSSTLVAHVCRWHRQDICFHHPAPASLSDEGLTCVCRCMPT